jgi:hypothetical protein
MQTATVPVASKILNLTSLRVRVGVLEDALRDVCCVQWARRLAFAEHMAGRNLRARAVLAGGEAASW